MMRAVVIMVLNFVLMPPVPALVAFTVLTLAVVLVTFAILGILFVLVVHGMQGVLVVFVWFRVHDPFCCSTQTYL
jgi:hypothetical protein